LKAEKGKIMAESRVLAAQDFAAAVGQLSAQMTLDNRLRNAGKFFASAGSAFLADQFSRQVKRREVRIPGPLNYGATAGSNNFTAAATTAFASAFPAWTYQNPTDRFAICWAMGLESHPLTTTTAPGVAPADGVTRQLRGLGSITLHPPYGKQIARSYAEFDMGPIDINVDTITTLVAAAQAQRNLRERLQTSVIDERVPLFVLQPNDTVTVDFDGLNGATVADSVSGVSITQYLLL
jgi:hypothetical protein